MVQLASDTAMSKAGSCSARGIHTTVREALYALLHQSKKYLAVTRESRVVGINLQTSGHFCCLP